MVLSWVAAAHAGYGDARDGLPTHGDRETFFWTNAVRVDPAAFADAYPCSFSSFTNGEQSPKPPLRYNADLTEAAVYHSTDMRQDGYFDHDSNDGTSWSNRIGRYYQGSTIGENIAYGYGSPYQAVVEGWMCSSGHRSNIMSGTYNEMGAGTSGTYYTQDFGFRSQAPDRAMSIGVHVPESPNGDVDFYVDWKGPVPDALSVVVDGTAFPLSLVVGTETQGVYGKRRAAGGGCQPYYFLAEVGGRTETFPETGSYGFGGCSWDDPGAKWLDDQIPLATEEEEDPDPEDTGTGPATTPSDDTGIVEGVDTADSGSASIPLGCGCGSSAAPSPAAGLALLLGLATRRKRRAA